MKQQAATCILADTGRWIHVQIATPLAGWMSGGAGILNRGIIWKANSLPYPESGIRLIRQDRVETFDSQFTQLQSKLTAAVDELEAHFDEIKSAARERLGSLFDASDYPVSLNEIFAMEWDSMPASFLFES